MTIRRRCTERNCKNGRRCLEHLRFDVMFRGKRYRIPANEFAIPRMEPGKQRPIQSMEEARDWERLFIGEIKAGRDPQRPPSRTMQAGSEIRRRLRVPRRVPRTLRQAGRAAQHRRRPEPRRRAQRTPRRRCRCRALEDPDDINRFKTDSEYAEDVEIATMHRVLETLRAAMNWGMAQTPPLFDRVAVSPVRRPAEQEGRDGPRPPAHQGRGEAAARHGAAEDEHAGAPVRRRAAARPHHRRPGALLPPRRDAVDSEQARELGHLPDRHPRRDGQGQGEPTHPVQPEGTAGGDSQTAGGARS